MKRKSILYLLTLCVAQIISGVAHSQCTWHTTLTDGFEYTTACPYVLPNTVYTSIPQTYSVHSGTKSLYMNFGDSGAATPPNVFAGDTIFKREIGICRSVPQRISAYLTTTFAGMQCNMRMLILDANNNVLDNTPSVLADYSPVWTNYQSGIFTSPTSTIYFVMITNLGGGNGNDLSMDDFKVENCWTLNLGHDTTLCNNQSITLDAGTGYTLYLWSDGSTTQSITATHSGSVAITLFYNVQVLDSSGCAFSDTLRVIFLPCSGVNEYNNGGGLAYVYPNPAMDEITVQLNDQYVNHAFFTLTDAMGRKIKKIKIENSQQRISIQGINSGVYFYVISSQNAVVSRGKIKIE